MKFKKGELYYHTKNHEILRIKDDNIEVRNQFNSVIVDVIQSKYSHSSYNAYIHLLKKLTPLMAALKGIDYEKLLSKTQN